MYKLTTVFFFLTLLLSCNQNEKKPLSAQEIVDKAILKSGKEKLSDAYLSFEFRNRNYQSLAACGGFSLKRVTRNEKGKIIDTYKSDGTLESYVNDSLRTLADSTAFKISESINSVHYFVQIPYRLNDNAVQKKYLGLDTLKNKAYHNIEITFKKEGGGTDYEDVFYYWFDNENFNLDYLAYSFKVNGGGIRFREAINERRIEGIRFVDYNNYKPKSKNIILDEVSKAFNSKELELLSTIENKNIDVKFLDKKCP